MGLFNRKIVVSDDQVTSAALLTTRQSMVPNALGKSWMLQLSNAQIMVRLWEGGGVVGVFMMRDERREELPKLTSHCSNYPFLPLGLRLRSPRCSELSLPESSFH
jgi:hypothetical protein